MQPRSKNCKCVHHDNKQLEQMPECPEAPFISRRVLLKAIGIGALGVAASTLFTEFGSTRNAALAYALDVNRACLLTIYLIDANTSAQIAGATVHMDGALLGTSDLGGTLVRRVALGPHELAASKDGYDNFSARINITLTDTFAFTAPMQRQTSTSNLAKFPVGVNYWWGMDETSFHERDLPLFKSANIHHVRLGRPLPETLPQYEAMVNRLISNGIEVLGNLQDERLVSDKTGWGKYVYDTVLHFKGKIRYWSVWNEPNEDTFRNNAIGYTEFLKTAYVRAKQADPQSFIISGGLLSTDGAVSYLTKMYNNGAQGFMDAVDVHPYCYPANPLEPNRGMDGHGFWDLPSVRDLMVKVGDADKKVWVTEFGYTTPGGLFSVGDGKTVTEQDQAAYLSEALQLASTWDWLDRFYVYDWMDSGDEEGQFGLIRGRWEPPYETKPSFDTVRNFNLNQQ
jgi:hypothetical protein